ncbi:hypothetical protein LXL04_020061 [Taraxacum kok-saghyz]
MMERGFYVSPQQCEDKFNDLNKRYKRVNDILGKGTACKVVENQSLLETMDHLPPKLKDEAKKLLNSKHLFFREMCAYHNSYGGGSGGGATAHHVSPAEVTTTEQPPHQRQNCVHSNNDDEEDDDDGEDDEDADDGNGHPDEEEDDGLSSRKRGRTAENDGHDSIIQQLNGEISCVIQDLTKNVWEKRQWMKGNRSSGVSVRSSDSDEWMMIAPGRSPLMIPRAAFEAISDFQDLWGMELVVIGDFRESANSLESDDLLLRD